MRIAPPRLLVLSVVLALRATAEVTPLERLQQTSLEWARLRSEASRLETSWSTDRGLLESTTAALEQRAKFLRERRDLLAAQTSEAKQDLNSLKERNRTLTEALEQSNARLASLAADLKQLQHRLPPRIQKAVALPFESLEKQDLPPSERVQFLSSILTRCTQFNSTVTTGEELLAVSKEAPERLMTVVYWGLSQAFAYDKPANAAYLGFPSKNGWEWRRLPGEEGTLKKLLGIIQGGDTPVLSDLPFHAERQPSEVSP